MLNKIIGFSLQNRILVLVASVLLLIGGTYTLLPTQPAGCSLCGHPPAYCGNVYRHAYGSGCVP